MKIGWRIVFEIAVCLMSVPLLHAQDFRSWTDIEGFVDEMAKNTTSSLLCLPPFDAHFGITVGTFTFQEDGFSDMTNAVSPRMFHGVPVYDLRIRETNDVSRVYITEVCGFDLRTNSVSAYNPEAWVRQMYGDPPEWLVGDALSKWYAERTRDRVELCLTLVPSSYESAYHEALFTEKTNYLARVQNAALSRDTNRVAFASVDVNTKRDTFEFTLYSPCSEPLLIDLFGRAHLESWDSWQYIGTVEAESRLTRAEVDGSGSSYFLQAARGDIDSDGDGIPDGLEMLHFRTNPHLWDSSGDGISDWMKLYRYGLNPLVRDSDGDGFEDDEEILSGSNPIIPTEGASGTIRYYLDDDDNLVGCYAGAGEGATTQTLTPAGNPATVHHRRAGP